VPFASRSATIAPGRTAEASVATSWPRYTSWPVLAPEPVWSTSRPPGSTRALVGSCIDTVPTARVQPDRLFADGLSFSMVTVLSMTPGCTATTHSVVTLAAAAADGLADATIGEALTAVRGEGEAPTDGVGTTTPGDGLATAYGEALLLSATDGDAPTEGAPSVWARLWGCRLCRRRRCGCGARRCRQNDAKSDGKIRHSKHMPTRRRKSRATSLLTITATAINGGDVEVVVVDAAARGFYEAM
jgi:hypothetical protein